MVEDVRIRNRIFQETPRLQNIKGRFFYTSGGEFKKVKGEWQIVGGTTSRVSRERAMREIDNYISRTEYSRRIKLMQKQTGVTASEAREAYKISRNTNLRTQHWGADITRRESFARFGYNETDLWASDLRDDDIVEITEKKKRKRAEK